MKEMVFFMTYLTGGFFHSEKLRIVTYLVIIFCLRNKTCEVQSKKFVKGGTYYTALAKMKILNFPSHVKLDNIVHRSLEVNL